MPEDSHHQSRCGWRQGGADGHDSSGPPAGTSPSLERHVATAMDHCVQQMNLEIGSNFHGGRKAIRSPTQLLAVSTFTKQL